LYLESKIKNQESTFRKPQRIDDETTTTTTTTTLMITTSNSSSNNDIERRNNNNGFFSRFRLLRGVGRRDPSTTVKTSTAYQDETTTFGEITDDEASFSSSFDDIDQLLALPLSLHTDDVVSSSSSASSASSASSSPTTTVAAVATSQPTIISQTYTTNSPTCCTITYDELPNDNSIYKCINLLSNHDIDLNRVGLQRLIMLTKGRKLSGLYNSEEIVSYILIYGGPFGSVEERLRYIFATMICNSPHNDNNANDNNNNNNDELYSDDYFDDYEEEKDALFDWISEYNPINNKVNISNNSNNKNKNNTGKDDDDRRDDRVDGNTCYSSEKRQRIMSSQHPEGKGNGTLHNHALRVLANALGKVSSSMKNSVVDDDGQEQEQEQLQPRQQIPLYGTIWKNIIRCIVDNIENTETQRKNNINGTGYSLKILRLLYEIQPQMIIPLLRHTLFTSLVYLVEYGNIHQFPMIHEEASYLLAAATATATATSCSNKHNDKIEF
jgi:hypothetical protein